MSIDGIGRPPKPPTDVGATSQAPQAGTLGQSFHVDRGEAAPTVDAKGPLAQLQRGEIGVDQYLDARVEEAVGPLVERLNPEALAFLRSSLRAELATDPVLIELVRRATAASPAVEP
jgi:hypothetical protein